MAMLAELVDGVIGVDTHRDTLTAAAVSHLGGVLAQATVRADAVGYQQLLDFACVQVPGRRPGGIALVAWSGRRPLKGRIGRSQRSWSLGRFADVALGLGGL